MSQEPRRPGQGVERSRANLACLLLIVAFVALVIAVPFVIGSVAN